MKQLIQLKSKNIGIQVFSLYFRNALVRSNYGNIPKDIYPTFEYLVMFFENLLQGKSNELKNRELYIEELFKSNN